MEFTKSEISEIKRNVFEFMQGHKPTVNKCVFLMVIKVKDECPDPECYNIFLKEIQFEYLIKGMTVVEVETHYDDLNRHHFTIRYHMGWFIADVNESTHVQLKYNY